MNLERRACLGAGLALLAGGHWGISWSAQPAPGARPIDPQRFEKEILAIEARPLAESDRGGILFLGSSSIRLWDVRSAFPGLPVVNRGFGGSIVADSLHYVERLVWPVAPRVIIFYAGDNDVARGLPPEQIVADYQAFVARVRERLPQTRIVFLSIKPSRSRESQGPTQRQVNLQVARWSARDPRLSYLDVGRVLLGADGRPDPAYFAKDQLHLSPAGYARWNTLLEPQLKRWLNEGETPATACPSARPCPGGWLRRVRTQLQSRAGWAGRCRRG